ncbi:Peroxisome biogenesis protein 6 [Ananas comosus]|uniref:Peroxisomal ATPase PEX6 n=1 Tax=Ananas comosus TaxID=4615 RepID=A0A199VCY0_ANACO|nr:Peroxisome biogenesis protein 6 [Ananas comosus]
MVERRRRPLILASTRAILDSVLNSAKSLGAAEGDGVLRPRRSRFADEDGGSASASLRLKAGILRFVPEGGGADEEFNELSSFVGVSADVLRSLAITSGSAVLIKNPETNVGRIVKAIVLNRPVLSETQREETQFAISTSFSRNLMSVLPCCIYPAPTNFPLNEVVAYVSPLLAFNLGLHVSCLKLLLRRGEESFNYLSQVERHETEECGISDSYAHVELAPWPDLPKYASHIRVSFVKVPECGILSSLRGNSTTEASDHQDMIDFSLNEYFKVDRFLARGDVFSVRRNWNCSSELCLVCNEKNANGLSSNIIYFKVTAIEPADEPILRVNRNQTALVLGGGAASAIPSYNFVSNSNEPMPLQGDTVKLLASILAPVLCPSSLSSKFRVSVLLYGPSGCGKRTVVRSVAHHLGLHVVEYSCHDLMESSERRLSAVLSSTFKATQRYSPCILLLRHFDVFANLSSNEGSPSDQAGITSEVASVIREFSNPLPEDEESYPAKDANGGLYFVEAERVSRHRVILIAAADSSEGLQPPIRRCFSHEVSMTSLSEEQRSSMISETLRGFSKVSDESINDEFIKDVIAQTSGFMPRDILALVADAGASFVQRVLIQGDIVKKRESREISSTSSMAIEDNNGVDTYETKHLGMEDFSRALERSKKRNASALGTPKVPNVKWEDVGGLEEVKKSILDTVQLPLMHKHLFSSGLRKRSGVLLYGPPGTGKTLLAKAVATECSLNFLSVKGPELINMYIGESEKNVRDIFQKARSARPCVIFFDELDSLAPARGASGDSGGVMDRVVSQMLAEIDGLNESSQDLFIIGASNRPDLIDPALLRPGRFDKLLYVGVNSDASYRERVLKALTRKFQLHEDVSLLSVAKKCPPNFTGADMYALCADAWFHAAKRKVSNHSADSANSEEKSNSVVVEFDDFVKVLGEISPSLSMAELAKYERLREKFEGPAK